MKLHIFMNCVCTEYDAQYIHSILTRERHFAIWIWRTNEHEIFRFEIFFRSKREKKTVKLRSSCLYTLPCIDVPFTATTNSMKWCIKMHFSRFSYFAFFLRCFVSYSFSGCVWHRIYEQRALSYSAFTDSHANRTQYQTGTEQVVRWFWIWCILTVCAKWNQYPHEDTSTLSFAYIWTSLYPIGLCPEMPPLLLKNDKNGKWINWGTIDTRSVALSSRTEFHHAFCAIPFTTSRITKQISKKYFILSGCLLWG